MEGPSVTHRGGVDRDRFFALSLQRFFTSPLDGIVFSFAAVFDFDPPGLDPSVSFHSVQNRIKHPVGPLDLVRGPGLDILDDRVAVAFALREDRKDQRLGRRGNEFLLHDANVTLQLYVVKRLVGLACAAHG